MIYVTHDQVEAMTLGDRIVVMHQGRIQQVGPPMEVYERPANRFVAGFIGSPPANFGRGRLRNSGGTAQLAADGLQVAWPPGQSDQIAALGEREVEFAVRPEHLVIVPDDSKEEEVCRGQVMMVEQMGDASLVHVEVGGESAADWSLVCKTFGAPPAAGSTIRLTVEAERVHLFDPQTGDNLAAA